MLALVWPLCCCSETNDYSAVPRLLWLGTSVANKGLMIPLQYNACSCLALWSLFRKLLLTPCQSYTSRASQGTSSVCCAKGMINQYLSICKLHSQAHHCTSACVDINSSCASNGVEISSQLVYSLTANHLAAILPASTHAGSLNSALFFHSKRVSRSTP